MCKEFVSFVPDSEGGPGITSNVGNSTHSSFVYFFLISGRLNESRSESSLRDEPAWGRVRPHKCLSLSVSLEHPVR